MDYDLVPTCVFTPIEYGACGLSEEDAQKKFGKENLSNYHIKFKPLEWQTNKNFAGGQDRYAYVKIVCNKKDDLRIVGYHLCAPNAGEVTQMMAVSMKLGVTKEQLDSTVGIHPTVGEDCIGVETTKEDTPDAVKSSC